MANNDTEKNRDLYVIVDGKKTDIGLHDDRSDRAFINFVRELNKAKKKGGK